MRSKGGGVDSFFLSAMLRVNPEPEILNRQQIIIQNHQNLFSVSLLSFYCV